jgi:hypothetical protein
MSYSPWGKIDGIERIRRGVTRVYTPSHGGMRVTKAVLNEYSISKEYLLTKGIALGQYIFFEEDCDMALFLFDTPQVLREYAKVMGIDENELFDSCKKSVNHWHKEYFNIEE